MRPQVRTALWEAIERYVQAKLDDDAVGMIVTHRQVEAHLREAEDDAQEEWRKLKERFGWSFETAEDAITTIEGNKRRTGECAHCCGEAPLCEGLVQGGHWYCCQECAEPYRQR